MSRPERQPDFAFTPLGPWHDEDGTWCCGLNCGKPCPYGAKIKPSRRAETRGREGDGSD